MALNDFQGWAFPSQIKKSLPEYYGWVPSHTRPAALTSECWNCGNSIHLQRDSMVYECDHCLRLQEE